MRTMTKANDDNKNEGSGSKGRYPSRKKAKYLAIPDDIHEVFKRVADRQDRSASALARKVIREFLESIGEWPPKPEEGQ